MPTYFTNRLDKSFLVLIGVVEDLEPWLDYFLLCNIKISWLPLDLNGLVPPVVELGECDDLGVVLLDELVELGVLGHVIMVRGDGGDDGGEESGFHSFTTLVSILI